MAELLHLVLASRENPGCILWICGCGEGVDMVVGVGLLAGEGEHKKALPMAGLKRFAGMNYT